MAELGAVRELADVIHTEAGLVALLLFIVAGIFFWLYRMERADRREAWKSHNELAKETNKTLASLTTPLEVIQELIKEKK